MAHLRLRCRAFSWQELNESHKRAWNYRRRAWGQAASRPLTGSATPLIKSQHGQIRATKVQNLVLPSRGVTGLRHSSSSSESNILGEVPPVKTLNMVYIGVGSNMGDRLKNIEDACDRIDQIPGTKITQTSSLWETKAMYVEDQAEFYNAVCEVSTDLDPIDLLNRLQAIENELGRVRVIDKGPRTIDLDILLFKDVIMNHERLKIPHPLIFEREFVLKPLSQLLPTIPLPATNQSAPSTLRRLLPTPWSTDTPTSRIISLLLPTPLPPLTPRAPNRRTHIMSILNLTPDSFSDGGAHHPLTTPASLAALARAVGAHAAHGAAVLDLGAESTRPGAAAVAPDEEWARLAPALDVARAGLAARPWCALSVDTRRGRVAAAALARGARVVNDVQGGADAALLAAAARARAGLVLGHTRGAPADMLRAPHAEYPGAGAGGVVEAVARELAVAVRRAMGAGVRRWRVAVDPGIGFAKRPAQSAEVMRGLGALREAHGLCGLPLVVGVSRKSVLRRMVMRDGEAVDADEDGRRRILAASVAGTVAAVQMGADVVRVHDVLENVAAARVADALYRGTPVVD